MRNAGAVFLGAAALGMAIGPLRAQETRVGQLLVAARAQLDVPEPDSAARLLERALDPQLGSTVTEQVRAWVLYGVAQLVKGQMSGSDLRAVAQQAFRRALERNPTERVDSLDVFGDDVVRLFNAERLVLAPVSAPGLALELLLPADTTIALDGGRLRIEPRPSHPARVILSIEPEGSFSSLVWADTQLVRGIGTLSWSPRQGGALLPEGRYVLRAGAVDSLQQRSAPVELRLLLSRAPADTTPLPWPLGQADFAPETLQVRRGAPAVLLWGATLGALIAVAPSVLGNADVNTGGADGTAYAVAGGVTLASVVGFLKGKRTRAIPENIERNQGLRERDRQTRDALERANAAARERAGVRIQVMP